eukprot:m.11585 g.11585  ORF g.11585 m.11585 type:complete len:341 (+) comp5748_c0_seq2:361-1383(+)
MGGSDGVAAVALPSQQGQKQPIEQPEGGVILFNALVSYATHSIPGQGLLQGSLCIVKEDGRHLVEFTPESSPHSHELFHVRELFVDITQLRQDETDPVQLMIVSQDKPHHFQFESSEATLSFVEAFRRYAADQEQSRAHTSGWREAFTSWAPTLSEKLQHTLDSFNTWSLSRSVANAPTYAVLPSDSMNSSQGPLKVVRAETRMQRRARRKLEKMQQKAAAIANTSASGSDGGDSSASASASDGEDAHGMSADVRATEGVESDQAEVERKATVCRATVKSQLGDDWDLVDVDVGPSYKTVLIVLSCYCLYLKHSLSFVLPINFLQTSFLFLAGWLGSACL